MLILLEDNLQILYKVYNILTNLKEVNLIFGIEATNYTDSRDIQVGENILSPYNNTIQLFLEMEKLNLIWILEV